MFGTDDEFVCRLSNAKIFIGMHIYCFTKQSRPAMLATNTKAHEKVSQRVEKSIFLKRCVRKSGINDPEAYQECKLQTEIEKR